MSDNYTGPVTLVTFIGPKDKFALTLHTNNEDPDSIEKIVKRYADDGYKPDLKSVRKLYKVNGTLTPREQTSWLPQGFRRASAHLR